MHIGVPQETAAGETRVALTPETAKKLKAQGHTVQVQSGAGLAASAQPCVVLWPFWRPWLRLVAPA